MTSEPDPAHRADRHESDERTVLRSFRKELSRSGGGDGVALYIDGDLARELHLDPATEVEVDVIERDGDVNLRIGGVPAGFTRVALREYAERRGWTETDSYLADGEWSLTYRDPTGLVRVEVDSTTHVDGSVANNVFVRGESIEVGEDRERYRDLRATADSEGLGVRVRDSEGLWQRLRGSADHDAGEAPDESTLRQLQRAADTVRIQLVREMASLNTTLEEIGKTVEGIRSVMEAYDVEGRPADGCSAPEE